MRWSMLLVCVLLPLLAATPLHALTPQQQRLLPLMDPATIRESLALVKLAGTWRADIARLEEQVQDAPPETATVARRELTLLLQIISERISSGTSQKLREHIAQADTLCRRLKDRQEETSRLLELAGLARWELLGAIDQLQAPAQFARHFLEEVLLRDYRDKPYRSGSFAFRLEPDDEGFQRSLFSPEANLTLVLKYQEDLEVRARGLYFRFTGLNELPEPCLDRVELADPAPLLARKLNRLGEKLPSRLGLGIRIEKVRLPDLRSTSRKHSGLGLDIVISDFLGGIISEKQGLLTIRGSCTIFPDGEVTFEGALEGRSRARIPAGPGLILDGFHVVLDPQTRKVQLETLLAPFPGADTIGLDVRASFALPLKKGLRMTGKLTLGRGMIPLGRVVLTLNPGGASGTLTVPDPDGILIPNLIQVKTQFRIDGKGRSTSGELSLLKLFHEQLALEVNRDGSSSIRATGQADLPGLRASRVLSGKLEPGLRKPSVKGKVSVQMDRKKPRSNGASR